MPNSPPDRTTRWKVKRWVIGLVGLAVLLWMGKVVARAWMIRRATAPAAKTQRIETPTRLPPLPRVPWTYAFRDPSREERTKLLRDILAVKLSTYPDRSAAGSRAGKHRTMGFTGFEPTPAELETLASHYDVFYLTALSSHRIPLIKRRNPKAKVLMYFACSLTQEEMQTVNGLWKRDFANATVLVNPNEAAVAYPFEDQRFDVLGRLVRSPVRLEALTGRLLMSNSRQR